MHGFELSGAADTPGSAAIFIVQQHDEIGMRREVVERTLDQLLDGLFGRQALQVQLALLGPDLLVDPFEYGKVERVLVTEIMIDQLLVDAGSIGNFVDPRAGEAALRKLPSRRRQQLFAGGNRIAALRLGAI